MHRLKEIKVYTKALAFTKLVRQVTRTFPKDELFVLTSQFRRSADSIVLNIAEGAGNSSNKEFSKFLDYSIRSGFECIGCLDIALSNDFINENDYQKLFNDVNELIAMMYGFQKNLRNKALS